VSLVKTKVIRWIGLILFCAVTTAACTKEQPKKVVIAIQPTLAAGEILEKSKPLREKLQSALPEAEVEIYVPMSYAAVVEAIRFGHVHAALMGAWPAHLAVQSAGAEVVLAELREVMHGDEKKEAPYYFSNWVVLEDSPLQQMQDLQGKNVCFPSPTSSSGYVAPLGKLAELGLVSKKGELPADPKTFFGEVLFGGGYQQCWTALQAGQVDVTVIAGDVPEKLYREVLGATRTLETQGPIPSHALVLSSDLAEPLRTRLVNAFLELGRPENREMMRGFVSGIFTGFQTASAAEHLKGLDESLRLSGIVFVERSADTKKTGAK